MCAFSVLDQLPHLLDRLSPGHKGGTRGGRGQRGANAFAPLFPLWL